MWYAGIGCMPIPLNAEDLDELLATWPSLCPEPPFREEGRDVGRLLMRHATKIATALAENAIAVNMPVWPLVVMGVVVPAVG